MPQCWIVLAMHAVRKTCCINLFIKRWLCRNNWRIFSFHSMMVKTGEINWNFYLLWFIIAENRYRHHTSFVTHIPYVWMDVYIHMTNTQSGGRFQFRWIVWHFSFFNWCKIAKFEQKLFFCLFHIFDCFILLSGGLSQFFCFPTNC